MEVYRSIKNHDKLIQTLKKIHSFERLFVTLWQLYCLSSEESAIEEALAKRTQHENQGPTRGTNALHWVGPPTEWGTQLRIRLIRSRLRIQPGANNDANNTNPLYMATLKVVLLKLCDMPMKNLRL